MRRTISLADIALQVPIAAFFHWLAGDPWQSFPLRLGVTALIAMVLLSAWRLTTEK